MSREIEFLIRRKFVKDVVFEFEDGITIYDFIRQLKDKEEEITRELGVGVNRRITISIEDSKKPEIILSVYKSDGGF